ncbi:hypothetical protein ABVT39_011233 [Epinephelus coioides]
MKPRCLLSTVDRLPTIDEMQESSTEVGDPDFSSHTMKEYVDSIKELSQPSHYPLHGPLRGHRRWMARACPGAWCEPEEGLTGCTDYLHRWILLSYPYSVL